MAKACVAGATTGVERAMLGLILAGSVIFVVGVLAAAFGIPVKEFSFGNTLILSGAILATGGVVLIGLGMVIRELRALGGRLAAAPSLPVATDTETLAPARPEPRPEPAEPPAVEQTTDAPASDVPPPQPEPEPPGRKRRNLLFVSSKRDKAAPPAGKETGNVPEETPPPEPAPAPVVETRATFEDAWPTVERSRGEAPRRPRPPATDDEARQAAPPLPPPIRRPAESPPVTILKSGVVDGMAYTLYSDGSIEAQLPEGMIRFASIDELRAHLDQRTE